jgi:hypothetical protein
LIAGSVIGSIILFGAWLILNTINPELLKLKTISLDAVKTTTLSSCCEINYSAQMGISKENCEKENGKYFEKANTISNGVATLCVDTGCCHCKLGGGITTLGISNSTCLDEKTMGKKILPETCMEACRIAGETQNLPWEVFYSWGQVCNQKNECAWSSGVGVGGTW